MKQRFAIVLLNDFEDLENPSVSVTTQTVPPRELVDSVIWAVVDQVDMERFIRRWVAPMAIPFLGEIS
jgi:hypothetical protein